MGHGRRTGKLSNLHLGALDPATGEYVMLGKTFKGLTDAMLEWQTQEFLARETHRDRVDRLRPAGTGRRKSLSATCRRAPAIRAGWRCGSRGSSATGTTSAREDADTMESVRRIYAAEVGATHR